MKRNITIYTLLCILFLNITSCKDDLLYGGGEMGEGQSVIRATVKFKPFTPTLNGSTRTAGNVIKAINSLCILLYDEEGSLMKKYPLTEGETVGEGMYVIVDENREGDEKTETVGVEDNKKSSAESITPHATFKLTVPYGHYYIYAVANMGDLSGYTEKIKTVEGLKSISLKWNEKEVAKNNQMFGYFTSGDNQDSELLTINQQNMNLHAWIRRAASKITIAYDGSELYENVYIYLKSVQIKDIPTECYLGKNSTINKDSEDDIENYGDLISEGESITYAEGTSYDEHWPVRITRGCPYYPYEEDKERGGYRLSTEAHAEDQENTLFFYENMQGTGKDKRQDATGPNGLPDGKLDAPGLPNDPDKYPDYKLKDDMPYGTYIEIKAYYVSNVDDRVGNGDITYRFMLGKNVTTNYDAERNHHYKLTLKFKNYANDVDWHIEYEEKKPGIEVPNPYYISYLYNKTMNLPIKINTGGGELVSLSANILTNNWAPHAAYGNKDQLDYAYWYDYDVTSQPGFSYGTHPVGNTNQPWNGFLSLRKTTAKILTAVQKESNGGTVVFVDNTKNEGNYVYYTSTKKGQRTYYQDKKQIDNDEENGEFSITPNTSKELINVSIPLYTRAKQMIISTGYTGNNPYVAYQRRATVEIKAVLKMQEGKVTEVKDTVEIFQVRRIVNPKGIYRKYNNNADFHVTLMRLPRENATEFQTFSSEGPWRATVLKGYEDFITISPNEGSTGTPIDFMVHFNGACGENQSRHAIIQVDYHNYTCQHLIFVQQGDASVELVEGGAKWHTRNLQTASAETSSPLDEGSLFKFGNLEEPIAASNQVNYRDPWINVHPEDFYVNSDPELTIVGKDSKIKWSNIKVIPGTSATQTKWTQLKLPGAHVAAFEDFYALFKEEEIEQAYGVLYGDESIETASQIQKVYGYRSMMENGESHTHGYGMRGCFIYNKKTCKSIFLPVGASGYGRRKRNFNENERVGVLRYSSSRFQQYPEPGLAFRPLFYDLYMRPGANYWLDRARPGTVTSYGEVEAHGWDINYYTFDFNHLSTSDMYKEEDETSDACFIRCVEDAGTQ